MTPLLDEASTEPQERKHIASVSRVLRGWAGSVSLVALIALVTVLFMGLWRGIWFDELLQFATGGMTFEYLVRTIDYSTIHVNHGQTGIYFLIDWLLLQIFGASAMALRLPSILAAIVMLCAAAMFLRAKGFGRGWQLVVVAALGANEVLMFYAGEARPYMPLAASATAMLAFYSLSSTERRRWWGRVFGCVGFIFGALIHPYWLFMWALIAVFSLAVRSGSGWDSRRPHDAWKFVAPAYVIPSILLYVAIGRLTWMRQIIDFGWDRNSIYNWVSLTNASLQDHFSFVPFVYPPRLGTGEVDAGPIVGWVIGLLVGVTVIWLAVDPRCRNPRLLPPALLGLIGLGSSILTSSLSYRSAYIIFERQWVVGMSLTAIAWTWFYAEWWRNTRYRTFIAILPAAAYVALVTVSLGISRITQLGITIDRYHAWQQVKADTRSIERLVSEAGSAESFAYDPMSPAEGFGYLANVNVARGGPVWDVFISWLNKEAGMRQEYRATDDNWSDLIWPNPSPLSYLCLPDRLWQCPSAP